MSSKNILKNASVIAFERKLCVSDGLMYSGLWKNIPTNDWKEIQLQHKDVRGTISNRQKNAIANDPLKLDAEIQKANIQAVDVASLPFSDDTLKISYSLRVLGGVELPSTCNNPQYQAVLKTKIEKYFEETQVLTLSQRYAENIANGRILWRNRLSAEDVFVRVNLVEAGEVVAKWEFDGRKFNLNEFKNVNESSLKGLTEAIQKGLLGKSFVFLKIDTFARVGTGQEVYPSQELVRDTGNEKHKKSKFLYEVNGVAALHSQKIGNALRTIDTWYPNVDNLGPIAVEPFGAVTSRGVAYRQPSDKMDFYSLLDGWILKDKLPPVEQQHYVVACLIRGGVFGEKEDK